MTIHFKSKAILKIVTVLIFVCLFAACKKQPKASFISDKEEYLAGDIIELKSTSSDAVSYQWYLSDGSIISDKSNFSYKIKDDWNDTTLHFTLIVYSKKEKKQSSVSKSIKIYSAGEITFMTHSSIHDKVDVRIDGKTVGYLYEVHDVVKGCTEKSCLTVRLKSGSHNLEGIDSGNTASGQVWVGQGKNNFPFIL